MQLKDLMTPEVERIHVLIRPKRPFGGEVQTPAERLRKEVFQSSVFDRLPRLGQLDLLDALGRHDERDGLAGQLLSHADPLSWMSPSSPHEEVLQTVLSPVGTRAAADYW